MLQLKTPLSPVESETLLQCLSEMEASLVSKTANSNQDFLKRNTLASAKQKVQSQVFDCFYHEEITNMVFALDSLSRKCNAQLTENISADEAANVGSTLRTAAITRAKLRRTISSNRDKTFSGT